MSTEDISIFFDGTRNNAEGPYETNVLKLYHARDKVASDSTVYLSGPGGKKGTLYEDIIGGAYGYGMWTNIKKAYDFLGGAIRDNHPSDEDYRIFLFGFSRGAYTAKLFSWLLQERGIPFDFKKGDQFVEDFQDKKPLPTKDQFRPIKSVEMIGLWDAVKSTKGDVDYHDRELPPNVKNAYHAMSLDEKRKKFPVLKWKSQENIRQVWFSGVHSDVGGGYRETGLSDYALRWMVRWAKTHDFVIDPPLNLDENLSLNPVQNLHDPFTENSLAENLLWQALGERARFWEGERADSSVQLRKESLVDYTPEAESFPNDPDYDLT